MPQNEQVYTKRHTWLDLNTSTASIIQWTRIFGTGVVELVCHTRSTPFPHPFHVDMLSVSFPYPPCRCPVQINLA
jgi:hypothetical protein